MSDVPRKYTPRFAPMVLDVSALTCKCFVWPVPRTLMHAGLISFHGIYRDGSGGADDSLFISWRIRELCELRLPSRICGLLVDFRDMVYDFGDDLSVDGSPLDATRGPIRVIVRSDQIAAFRGQMKAHRLHTELEVAAAEVSDLLRRLRSDLRP